MPDSAPNPDGAGDAWAPKNAASTRRAMSRASPRPTTAAAAGSESSASSRETMVNPATFVGVSARVRSEPETPRSRRTLPLPGMLAEALAAHLAAHPPGSDGTLFTTRTGQPYRHDYYGSIIFAKAVRDAGLPAGTTSRGGEASRPAPVIRRSGRRSARG